MSLVFYRALGADLGKAFQDGTHHNNYGSYELAKCVVEGIRKQIPGLAKYLADGVKEFDPAIRMLWRCSNCPPVPRPRPKSHWAIDG